MTMIFGIFLLTLLLITAVAIVRTKDLFVAVMLLGIASLLIAANFFLLDAADVALTEAAVGAGISTVLFLGALRLTWEGEDAPNSRRVMASIVVGVTALVIIYTTLDNPHLGAPDAPTQIYVAPWYIEKTREFIDIPNVVTAVLGSFRGYDTLGEVFVVLTAGIGVLFLLASGPGARHPGDQRYSDVGLRQHLIPRVVGRLLIPFILLFGLYVQFHGEYSPGGGFQAGAIIAAAIILFALLEGEEKALSVIPRHVRLGLMAGGAILYSAVGVAGIVLGGNFLDYSVLAEDPVKGQQLGILLIEAGVGITVTGVLLSIFHAFAARGR
jgi:multicomponent Na+:H+ antiporter subunit B